MECLGAQCKSVITWQSDALLVTLRRSRRLTVALTSKKPIEHLRRAAEMARANKDDYFQQYGPGILAVLLERGSDEGDQHRGKGETIMNPTERQLWKQAGEAIERGDRGELYYWSAAMHHGLGYHRKRIEVDVHHDGSATLTGTCHLLATGEIGVLDNYLQTVPGRPDIFRFTSIKSLSPGYALRLIDLATPAVAHAYIPVDPPIPAGKELEYMGKAEARAGTIATTAEALRESGLAFEYMSWQVIVPIRWLEIAVTIPSRQEEPLPKFWSELKRIVPVPKPETAAYLGAVEAAYLAQTSEGLGAVKVESELPPPVRRQLTLTADHPWLAFRQVMAWEVR
jgi:hypothetical protein